MSTRGDQTLPSGGGLVGDQRRLHDLLTELRQRRGGPSLRKINGVSGVSVGHLSQIFAGKTAPGPDVAVKIAQALQATDREQARARFLAESVEADRSAQRAGDSRRERRPGWKGCPYLGLPPFEEHHARVFYGRRALTGRLLDRLRRHPGDAGVLLVLGPSGAGKSSLLRAGLMGSLAQDALMPGCQFWPRRVITPTGDPIRHLAVHLAELAGTDAITTYESLKTSPEQAHLLVGQVLAAAGHPRLILVVDQLEELFTLSGDPADQQRFLTALHSMATRLPAPDGRPGALIVAGIRGDFVDQCMAYPTMRQAAEAGVFAVGAMSESELREAVTGPAAETGVRVPDDLCAAILDDLRARNLPTGYDSGVLPLLSQAMFVMWEAGKLTLDGYHHAGGVADIVRTSAEQVYDTLDADQQDLTRRLFLHLTTVTEGKPTRRPSTRNILRTATGSDLVDPVIEAFASRRLITVAENGLVTIAHEELLRSWDRLRDWLQPSLTDQALRRTLAEDVHTWQHHRRDSSYLYSGARLVAADDAVQRWTDDPGRQLAIDAVTSEFLQASGRRSRRRRRVYQAVAAAMAMLLVLAINNAIRVDRQHAVAQSRQLAALSRATSGTDRIAAERLATTALTIAGTDEAFDAVGPLLADHRSVLPGDAGTATFSPEGKLLLATADPDGTVRVWDPQTGLLAGAPLAAYGDPRHRRPGVTFGPRRPILFSPDGKLLATAGQDGMVRLWDPLAGRVTVTLPVDAWELTFAPDGNRLVTVGAEGPVLLWDPQTGKKVGAALTEVSAAFSPKGRRLATGAKDGTVQLRDPDDGRAIGKPLTGHTGVVHKLLFSPDGRTLATSSDDETVQLWDARTGGPVGPPLQGRFSIRPGVVDVMDFNPAGTVLATSDVGGAVRLWDARRGRSLGSPLAVTGEAPPIAISPDGELIAVGGFDGVVQLWDLETRRPVDRRMSANPKTIRAVEFSPDGSMLATSGEDQAVRLWDPDTGQPFVTPLAGTANIEFSADGRLLATVDEGGKVWIRDPTTGHPLGGPLPAKATKMSHISVRTGSC
ncbi:AAA family ATPase [Actinoplanes sp. NPDC049668]|uniref:nSTAND1 domain-containing NTPase n=1 Tax=unclassified Actinoplanes TaxID=2626549 RepID=UPI0033BD65D2